MQKMIQLLNHKTMSLDKNLIDQFIDITSLAAIACYQHIGKAMIQH